MENRTAKGGLFTFVFVILLLPLLQHALSLVKSGELLCASTKTPYVTFSFPKWWDGSYQKEKTLVLNDSVGFRPDLVRLNNQIDFSLFRKLSSGNIIGYDGYVFGKEDVLEYSGDAYMGTEAIREEMIEMKHLQDTLRRLGKTFVFVYAPSKAHYVPEKIPGLLTRMRKPRINNYKMFRVMGDSLKINQLDYVALFGSMRDTSQNLLMTRQGYHWSIYGSLIATDTMIKFIERERNITMPHLVLTKTHHTETASDSDDDLVKCTNLIFPLAHERYSYAEHYYQGNTQTTRPRVFIAGDSFVWGWIAAGFLQNATASWKYWSYFGDMWTEAGVKDIRDYEWKKALAETDCVIVLVTTTNLHLLPRENRFVGQIYHHFYP